MSSRSGLVDKSVTGQPTQKTPAGNETINEFPAFSFLLADMHPHVMALPLVLLALSAGCQSDKARDPARGSKNEEASLRLHLEVNPDGSDRNAPVSIGREHPFLLNVERHVREDLIAVVEVGERALVDGLPYD